jgi:hypothetical protein
MQVTPYNLPFTWQAVSATRQDVTHLVELTKDGPVCSCEDYQCRVGPKRRLGVRRISCKHGRAAMEAFAEWALNTFHEEIAKVHASQKQKTTQVGPIGAKRVPDEKNSVVRSLEQEEILAGRVRDALAGVQEAESDLSGVWD